MRNIRKRSFGRWLGIPAIIVLILALSACHYHFRRHHYSGEGPYHDGGRSYYGAHN